MNKIKRTLRYFTKAEIILWSVSVSIIVLSFCLFNDGNYLNLIASLIGVTSLIFIAKGNPVGQILIVIFSSLYGIISYSFSYYGEMITYLLMTLPMALIAFVSWIKNPYKNNKAEVKINKSLSNREITFLTVLTAVVTFMFYFVLKRFGTANLWPSTFSVTTSFVAAYLTFRRSPYFALAYATNDLVLIILWTLASFENTRYISVVVCFLAFLFNDIYSFINWQKMKKRQLKKPN